MIELEEEDRAHSLVCVQFLQRPKWMLDLPRMDWSFRQLGAAFWWPLESGPGSSAKAASA